MITKHCYQSGFRDDKYSHVICKKVTNNKGVHVLSASNFLKTPTPPPPQEKKEKNEDEIKFSI